MLSARIEGVPLSYVGAHGPITVTHTWPGGLDSASWEMDPDLRHPLLRGNALVAIFDSGYPIGQGTLLEPGFDGKVNVMGAWRKAQSAPAVDSGGAFTTVPDTALDSAIAASDVNFRRSGSISATAVTTTADGSMQLADLLDRYCDETSQRWAVDGYGMIYTAADPTTHRWTVPNAVAGRGLAPAEDEFYNVISARYISSRSASGDVYALANVGSADSVAAQGRRRKVVELDDLDVITVGKAVAVAQGIFLRSGARMGWSEGLDLGYGQITTPGGRPAPLAQIQAGHMVRLAGVLDNSRPFQMPSYLDVVIGESTYTDGSNRIQLKPVGMAARNLPDIITEALENA